MFHSHNAEWKEFCNADCKERYALETKKMREAKFTYWCRDLG